MYRNAAKTKSVYNDALEVGMLVVSAGFPAIVTCYRQDDSTKPTLFFVPVAGPNKFALSAPINTRFAVTRLIVLANRPEFWCDAAKCIELEKPSEAKAGDVGVGEQNHFLVVHRNQEEHTHLNLQDFKLGYEGRVDAFPVLRDARCGFHEAGNSEPLVQLGPIRPEVNSDI